MRFWQASLVGMLVAMVGCSGASFPFAAGSDYFGIGYFESKAPEAIHNPNDVPVRYIDVRGFGLFASPQRVNLGYIHTNLVVIPPDSDVYLRLSKMEIATGREAETTGLTMILPSRGNSVSNEPIMENAP